MLKRRKTPLHFLYGEREAIRIYPIKNNNMNTNPGIPISQIKLEQTVVIGQKFYTYKGQTTKKKGGIKKSIHLFKGMVFGTPDMEIDVTKVPTFRKDKYENYIMN